MLVVLGELEIPVEFAGVGVECQQGVAVQIVARPAGAAIRGGWISRWPEDPIRCGIVCSRIPCRRPTDFPGFALPRLVSGFPGARNCVEAPFALAGVGVVSVDESTD